MKEKGINDNFCSVENPRGESISTSILIFKSFLDLSLSDAIYFSAYYPHSNKVYNNPEAFEFNVNEEAECDLMVAPTIEVLKQETVHLNFKRVMHHLVVTLTKDANVSGNLAEAKLSLLGMKSTAIVNLVEGTIEDSYGAAIYPSMPYYSGESYHVVPQVMVTGEKWMEIELDGDTYTYKVPEKIFDSAPYLTLQSGYRTYLNLKKNNSGTDVVLVSSGIEEWSTQGTISLEPSDVN